MSQRGATRGAHEGPWSNERERSSADAEMHATGPVPDGAPSHEAIAARAYALFLARGGGHGDDWADWLHAEAELRAEGMPPGDTSAQQPEVG